MLWEDGDNGQYACRVPEHIFVFQPKSGTWQVGIKDFAFGKSRVDESYYIMTGGDYIYRGNLILSPKLSLEKLRIYTLFS